MAERFPAVRCIALDRNYGACAKAFGADVAWGELIVFLDDDSYPRPGSLTRMAEHFAADPHLGAASFLAHLPDGRRECCALHNMFIGCGVGLRRTALAEVGGLDRSLFMAAEEYDLSFRLINGGWRVQTFADLHVDHLKSPQARASDVLVSLDTRNNLWLAARYLPRELAAIYRRDWAQRYRWLAQRSGQSIAYWRGYVAGMLAYGSQRRRYAQQRLGTKAVETIFNLDYTTERMRRLDEDGVGRVVFAGFGKNIHAFVQAARRCGIKVVCIADDTFAAPGRTYRGIPIVPVNAGLISVHDAVVIANTSPEQARRMEEVVRAETASPVHRWFDYVLPGEEVGISSEIEPACARA
ncbi:MAG TPA: glycosyltransferase family 2 protein [Phycisphaerae bacterium]|nr:glycosyltransferase family 2 protein [Phycisphaerae bacterium]